jgi:hypothetical protein
MHNAARKLPEALSLGELAELVGARSIADLEQVGRFVGLLVYYRKGFGYGVPLSDLEKWRAAYAACGTRESPPPVTRHPPPG